MTEAEWATCTDPRPMLKALKGRAEDEQLRAFAAASCRLVWELLTDERSRQAVVGAERFAQGQATASQLAGWHSAAEEAHDELCTTEGHDYDMDEDYRKRCDAAQAAFDACAANGWTAAWNVAMMLDWRREDMARLLRGLFAGVGDPRPRA